MFVHVRIMTSVLCLNSNRYNDSVELNVWIAFKNKIKINGIKNSIKQINIFIWLPENDVLPMYSSVQPRYFWSCGWITKTDFVKTYFTSYLTVFTQMFDRFL